MNSDEMRDAWSRTSGKPVLKRQFAVKYAMGCMGSAMLGSAVTTLGSSAFLLGCTMRIFIKLALILIAVTLCTLLFSLVVMPSALLVLGPLEHTYFHTASFLLKRCGLCGFANWRRAKAL